MKNLKWMTTLIIALSMVLGLGVTAFAEDYTNAETVTIKKEYNLDGEGKSPEEIFTITQSSSSVEDGDASSAPDLISITPVSYAKEAAGSTAKIGNFIVTLPTYEKTGIYKYVLTETDNKTAGVTYFEDEIELFVTVVEQDGLVRVAAVHAEDDSSEKSDTFENIYTANQLTVSKAVTGNLGDKSKEFSFTVTFTAPAGKTWTNEIEIAAGSGAASMTQNGNTYTFTLSDGDSVTFENIPEGVTYTVVEDDYSDDGYETSYDGKQTGEMENAPISTTVTNDKDRDVDTGIDLGSSLPYILILAVIVCAGVIFVISRKRRMDY